MLGPIRAGEQMAALETQCFPHLEKGERDKMVRSLEAARRIGPAPRAPKAKMSDLRSAGIGVRIAAPDAGSRTASPPTRKVVE